MKTIKGRVKEIDSDKITVSTDEGDFDVKGESSTFRILQRVEIVLSDRNEVQFLRAR